MTFEYTIEPYQRETIDYGIKNPYIINALEQGLGKTLCSVLNAWETKSKTLIVCPAYLRLKWKKEINKFVPNAVVSLFETDKEFYHLWDTDFAIISYYFAEKAEILFEWADMVICDEAHQIKTMTSKRSEAIHKFVYENSIKRVNLLTGTPIQNRVHEFYSLIALCQYNPKIEESSFLRKYPTYVDFANRFSFLEEYEIRTGSGRRKVQKWSGFQNIDELQSWLKGIYIRIEADSVLNLPPIVPIEVPVRYIDNPELLEAFETFSAKGENNSIQSRVKAQAALATAHFTAEYALNLLEQGISVVVYSDHPAAAELIAKKLGVTHIDGTTKMHIRQMLADRLQSGESDRIVATIGAFSTGIDLFESQNLILNDPPFVPGDLDQVYSRLRRRGQKHRVFVHKMIGSIQSEKIYDLLDEKNKTIKAVIKEGAY